jgi:FkbM family methyltransferase
MTNAIVKFYRILFARALFNGLNKLIYRCSLSGLGILNYESDKESGEVNFLKNFLKDRLGGVVIDVGANVGDYSKLVLDINKSVTVYAFEPHPKTFAKLSDAIRTNNFHPINAAVSNVDGFLSLYDYEAKEGSSHASLYKEVIKNIHHSKAVEYKVRACCLDEFVKSKNIQKIDLLKIDTEGNELNVLRGMSEFIRSEKIEVIHFEFNEMNVYSRTFFKDFWDMLPRYDFYRLLPLGMVKIERYSPFLCEIFAYQNIVTVLKHH